VTVRAKKRKRESRNLTVHGDDDDKKQYRKNMSGDRLFASSVSFPRDLTAGCAASFEQFKSSLKARMRTGEGYFVDAAYGLFYEQAESVDEARALLLSRFGDFSPQFTQYYDEYDVEDLSYTRFSVDGLLADGGDVFCTPLISVIIEGHELPRCTLEELGSILLFDLERFLLPEGIAPSPVQRRTVDAAEDEIAAACDRLSRRLEREQQQQLDGILRVTSLSAASKKDGDEEAREEKQAKEAKEATRAESKVDRDDGDKARCSDAGPDTDSDSDELYFVAGQLVTVRDMLKVSRRLGRALTGFRFQSERGAREMSMLHVVHLRDRRLLRKFARASREQQLFTVHDTSTMEVVRAYARGAEYMTWQAVDNDLLYDDGVSLRSSYDDDR